MQESWGHSLLTVTGYHSHLEYGGLHLTHSQDSQGSCIVFLYSAQYLQILQDSKRYLTHPTEQSTVQALK